MFLPDVIIDTADPTWLAARENEPSYLSQNKHNKYYHIPIIKDTEKTGHLQTINKKLYTRPQKNVF